MMLALLLAAAALQEAPAATPAPATDTTEIALGQDRSERMTVPVSIGGSQNYPFIIDTGAERTVVSAQLARTLNLQAGPPANLISISGAGRVSTVVVPSLEISGTQVRNIQAPALDQAHIGAAGMLGIDSLKARRILIDFKRGTMTVAPAHLQEEKLDPDTIVVKAKSRYGQLILVDSSIDGKKIQVIIDTGAQTSIGNLALKDKLLGRKDNMLPLIPVTLTSVTGGQLVADFTQIRRIKVGGLTLTNVPVAFSDAEPFKKFGVANRPALLLGMDALRLFARVSVDFANKQVRFVMHDSSERAGGTELAAK